MPAKENLAVSQSPVSFVHKCLQSNLFLEVLVLF